MRSNSAAKLASLPLADTKGLGALPPLPPSRWFTFEGEKVEWANQDPEKEKSKSIIIIDGLTHQLEEAKKKLNRLLDGYLDKVVDSSEYQKKKNELLEEKLLLKGKIKEV